jgi:hypothetical protein
MAKSDVLVLRNWDGVVIYAPTDAGEPEIIIRATFDENGDLIERVAIRATNEEWQSVQKEKTHGKKRKSKTD